MPRASRRSFLCGLGGALLGSQVRGGRAFAQSARPKAKRLIVFFSPNGTVHRHWRPAGEGASWSIPAGSILEALAPQKDQLLVLDGLDFKGASNHEGGMAAMLTGGPGADGAGGGASVDQFVARAIGGETRFASVELGVHTSAWGGSVQTRMCYRRAGEMIPPNDQPADVYQRLFGQSAGDAALARRRSVLDVVRADIASLRPRLGAEQRGKLELHLDALRDVERGLTSTGVCAAPAEGARVDARANDLFPQVGRLQADLMVAGLACDLTRVASLQWSHTVSPTVFSWLSLAEGHHALSHMDDSNTAGVMAFVMAERWFAEQFAYLVSRLAAMPEPGGDGTMLDHSLVLWAKEMGDSRLHECKSVPFVLAGKAGGFLRPGRYLRFGGVPHQRLLVSVCNAMGVETTTFGDTSFGVGGLEGLS